MRNSSIVQKNTSTRIGLLGIFFQSEEFLKKKADKLSEMTVNDRKDRQKSKKVFYKNTKELEGAQKRRKVKGKGFFPQPFNLLR